MILRSFLTILAITFWHPNSAITVFFLKSLIKNRCRNPQYLRDINTGHRLRNIARWILFSLHQVTGTVRVERQKNPVLSSPVRQGLLGSTGVAEQAVWHRLRGFWQICYISCGTSHEGNKQVSLQEPRSINTAKK